MKPFFLLLFFLCFAFGAEPVAVIKELQGAATVQRNNTLYPLHKGDYLYSGDTLQTTKHTDVGLSFNDGTRIAIGSETVFVIDEYFFAPAQQTFKFNVHLPKGSMVFESGRIGKLAPEKVKIKVPQGIIGIRGTKFAVEVEE